MRIVDLFAGAGGWDSAARDLGHHVDRVENWAPASLTAAAAGFHTVHEDVRTFDAEPGDYNMVLGSPSCKRYSAAGNGAGRRALDRVLKVVDTYRGPAPAGSAEAAAIIGDADAALVVEPLRIIAGCIPMYAALEQTPAVLPIWDAYADLLRERGYSVATAVLSAEQYGTPQTRRRAILVARRDGIEATMPVPSGDARSLGATLGLPAGAFLVSNYGTGGDPRRRGIRNADQYAPTITSKADRIKVHAPGRAPRNLTPAEAAALQGFPPGYPFRGNKGEIMEQIGNAVPYRLAHAILSAFPRGVAAA